MFVALPLEVYDPSLMTRFEGDPALPGLVRLGFTASIVVNLLVAIGLVIQRELFR